MTMPSENLTNQSPWGSWELVYTSPETTVKILRVVPGGMLSLQTHEKRSEHWTPLDQGLACQIDGATYEMQPGVRYDVPVGTMHRIWNPSDTEVAVVEVITGEYDEHDIVRLHDIYDR